jgi:hypothetical protein
MQKTIYLEVNVDNSAATWFADLNGTQHRPGPDNKLLEIKIGKAADLLANPNSIINLFYANLLIAEMQLKIDVKWFYTDNTKVYLDDVYSLDPNYNPVPLPDNTYTKDLTLQPNTNDDFELQMKFKV